MDFAFVAMLDGLPVAVTHTDDDMMMLLAEFSGGELVEYKPYYSKYPSVNDYHGSYYYEEANTNEILEYKVFLVTYLREDQK